MESECANGPWHAFEKVSQREEFQKLNDVGRKNKKENEARRMPNAAHNPDKKYSNWMQGHKTVSS